MTRKSVAIICFLFIFCLIDLGYGEELHNKSVEELITLQKQINGELASRGYDETPIYGFGMYEVGIDIAPGSYILTAIAKEEDWNCEMCLYASYEDMINGTTTMDYKLFKFPIMQLDDIKVNDPVRLRLVEGQIVIFGYGTYCLKKI